MVFAFAENEIGALARRQNILAQVHEIDRVPQRQRGLARLVLRQRRIAVEISRGIAEGGLTQTQEALDIPVLHERLARIDIDRKVEKVGDEGNGLAILWQDGGLKHVESLDDDDIGMLDNERLPISEGNVPQQVPTVFAVKDSRKRVIGLIGGGVQLNATQTIRGIRFDDDQDSRLADQAAASFRPQADRKRSWWWD